MKTIPTLAAGLLLVPALHAADKPNIVIYLADDHGCAQSEPYGDTFIHTPKMQELAREGMLFERAYIASPASGPSRAALLSGMMPAHNGAEANHQMPRPETQTMVRQLQAQGYEVVAIGKIAHDQRHTAMCGFDYSKWIEPRREDIARCVEEYLKNRTSNKPLCLLVGDRRPPVLWTPNSSDDPAPVNLPDYLIDTPESRAHWGRYLTDVTGVDTSIAQVDSLVAAYFGNRDYLFAYSADHGAQWPFGKWNLYDLGIRVPLLVRWPGHTKAGSRTDAMVSWVDIFPTLIELGGGKASGPIDGRSFANVLTGKASQHRTEIYTTHTSDGDMNLYPIRSIRTERFKYIRNLRPDCYHSNHSDILRKNGAGAYWDSWEVAAAKDPAAAAIIDRYYRRPAEELYDIVNDPGEQHNLANDPAYKKMLKELSSKLDAWIKAQGDQLKLPGEPYPLSGPTPHEVHMAKVAVQAANKKKQ